MSCRILLRYKTVNANVEVGFEILIIDYQLVHFFQSVPLKMLTVSYAPINGDYVLLHPFHSTISESTLSITG